CDLARSINRIRHPLYCPPYTRTELNSANARQAHKEALARNEAPTLWRRLAEHPFQVTLVMVAVVLIALLTLLPFIGLAR
ncbi:hypothetical protein LL249_15370, partial [Halomonas axialensis]|nr:hypothetical protein [Halomonas axialensis]